MSRPAPSFEAIADLAATVTRHALRGLVVEIPEAAMAQMHSAIPGKPGAGLDHFNRALHRDISCRTMASGAWRFFRRSAPTGEGMVAALLPGSGPCSS